MVVLLVASAGAAELHVSPAGSPAGDGSEVAPWDLATALSGAVPVGPGDTIWLHGGTYGDGDTLFSSSLTGFDYAPVVVRQAPGERATIDGGIEAYGAHTWFQGFEITSSLTDRTSARLPGLALSGDGNKAINLVVHDTGHPGIGLWQASGAGGEVYGCIVWGTGTYDGGGVPIGDGVASDLGPHGVRDVIAFRNLGRGIADGAALDGVVAFENGDANVYASAAAGLSLTDSSTFRRSGEERGGSVVLGDLGVENGDARVTGNVLVHGGEGERGLFLEQWAFLEVRDNRIVGDRSWATWDPPAALDGVVWGDNGYWGPGAAPFAVGDSREGAPAALLDWPTWRESTGFDTSSGQSPSLPTGAWLTARVNAYDGDRAHVIVHDWDGAGTVSWDPSGWLLPGSPYRVLDAQDVLGPPLIEGVFDGAPIALPTMLSTVAPLVGDVTHLEDLHTAPAFVVYVVDRSPPPAPADTGDTGDTGRIEDSEPPSELTTRLGDGGDANRTRCGCGGGHASGWLALVAVLAGQRRRKPVSST
jgi:hypothetical protein